MYWIIGVCVCVYVCRCNLPMMCCSLPYRLTNSASISPFYNFGSKSIGMRFKRGVAVCQTIVIYIFPIRLPKRLPAIEHRFALCVLPLSLSLSIWFGTDFRRWAIDEFNKPLRFDWMLEIWWQQQHPPRFKAICHCMQMELAFSRQTNRKKKHFPIFQSISPISIVSTELIGNSGKRGVNCARWNTNRIFVKFAAFSRIPYRRFSTLTLHIIEIYCILIAGVMPFVRKCHSFVTYIVNIWQMTHKCDGSTGALATVYLFGSSLGRPLHIGTVFW